MLCRGTDQAEWHINPLVMGRGIDLAFIDGDHEAPGVRIDCRVVASKVKGGGVLTAHDYGRDSLPGVFLAMNEYALEPNWKSEGVFGTLGVWRRMR